MREALLIRAHLIAALHDIYALVAEYSMGLLRSLKVEIKDSLMVFLRRSFLGCLNDIVSVILFVVLVVLVG